MGFLLLKAQHLYKGLIFLLAVSFASILSEPYSAVKVPSICLVKLMMLFQCTDSSARKSGLIGSDHDHKRVL